MRRLEIRDADIMRVVVQQEIQRSEESRYDRRLHGVLLCCSGFRCYEVADILGQSPRTETDPVLLNAPPPRKSVAVFGAVRPEDGHVVVDRAQPFSTKTFCCSLQHLLGHRRHRRLLTVILDNATYHHAHALRPWLFAH